MLDVNDYNVYKGIRIGNIAYCLDFLWVLIRCCLPVHDFQQCAILSASVMPGSPGYALIRLPFKPELQFLSNKGILVSLDSHQPSNVPKFVTSVLPNCC